jgi:hypothetical protein
LGLSVPSLADNAKPALKVLNGYAYVNLSVSAGSSARERFFHSLGAPPHSERKSHNPECGTPAGYNHTRFGLAFDNSPTVGMHDLGTAAMRAGRYLLRSPHPLLERTRLKAPELACRLLLAGTGASRRPFSRPQRLPVLRVAIPRSKIPTCPSTPAGLPPNPFGRSSLDRPVSRPASGPFFPLPDFHPAHRAASRTSTPRWGFLLPSGSKRSVRSASQRPTVQLARFPFAPHTRL